MDITKEAKLKNSLWFGSNHIQTFWKRQNYRDYKKMNGYCKSRGGRDGREDF
jgi:hypothetical protein